MRFGLGLAGLMLAPVYAQAQTAAQASPQTAAPTPVAKPAPSAPVDADLRALIPDEALVDPVKWALDTDAAHQAPDLKMLPDIAWLNQPGGMPVNDTAIAAMPGMTIAWPDSFTLPAFTPLTPDADIAVVEGVARDAGTALDVAMPRGASHGPIGDDAVVHHVAPGIDLVFPHGIALPELDDLSDRFVALSSLRTLSVSKSMSGDRAPK